MISTAGVHRLFNFPSCPVHQVDLRPHRHPHFRYVAPITAWRPGVSRHMPKVGLADPTGLLPQLTRGTDRLPTSGAPLAQLRALGSDSGVVAVAGVDPRGVRQPVEDLGLDVAEQLRK